MHTQKYIDELQSASNCRTLVETECSSKYLIYNDKQYLNLSSNDYLGLSDNALQAEFLETVDFARFVMSNPASRLMTGNSADYERLESSISRLYGGRSALVLSSGFAVNSGVLPALTSKNDVVIADKYVHASIIDGLRLCSCPWQRFRHNDMDHLEQLICRAAESPSDGDIWVVVESLYSMDGDFAPIGRLLELKHRYGIKLYIDEAHAFGVYGSDGCGVVQQYADSQGLEWGSVCSEIDVLVATMGKALASAGAFLVCDDLVRQVLINRLRTLIYSTAMPPISLMWSDFLVRKLPSMADRRAHLQRLVSAMGGRSQIIPIIIGTNLAAIAAADALKSAGYWVTAIRHPTVAEGTARLRISLSAAISETEITKFAQLCRNIG